MAGAAGADISGRLVVLGNTGQDVRYFRLKAVNGNRAVNQKNIRIKNRSGPGCLDQSAGGGFSGVSENDDPPVTDQALCQGSQHQRRGTRMLFQTRPGVVQQSFDDLFKTAAAGQFSQPLKDNGRG